MVPLSLLQVWADDASATVAPSGPAEQESNDDLNRSVIVSQHDICTLQVDAVVNPTDTSLTHSSPLASRIAAAAGPELMRESAVAGKLTLGQALQTKGYRLPARMVLHTALPKYLSLIHI